MEGLYLFHMCFCIHVDFIVVWTTAECYNLTLSSLFLFWPAFPLFIYTLHLPYKQCWNDAIYSIWTLMFICIYMYFDICASLAVTKPNKHVIMWFFNVGLVIESRRMSGLLGVLMFLLGIMFYLLMLWCQLVLLTLLVLLVCLYFWCKFSWSHVLNFP